MPNTQPIKIGQKVELNPFKGLHLVGFGAPTENVIGTVTEVYASHRRFDVEYKLNDVTMRTSFNFADLGENVYIVNET
jgi:hypothetical protein